jgi:hypothetical protein
MQEMQELLDRRQLRAVESDASCSRDRVLLRLILGQNVLEAWKDDFVDVFILIA